MNEVIRNIYKSVSVRLSVSILTFVVVIFAVTMTILIHRSKASVRQAAIEESGQMLTNTAQRLTGIMDEVEVATLNTYWQVFQQLQPDSLLALSARILELNPMLNGCSIAMEPNFFPSEGRYFSAYSFNNDGYIDTENEGSDDYPYFNMDWYQEPLKKGKACWVDPFQDYNPSGIYSRDVIASFCKPLVTERGKTIGVISVDLSQRMLSKILTREWRYPDSYFILVGAKNTIIATSKVDAKMADLKRRDCLVLEQPLSDSGWRLALVCPEEDIFRGYNNMIMIIVSVMVFGLLFMFAICYYIVRRTMEPVIKLTKQTTDIAEGHFDSQIAPSTRIDEVGKLQNSFHTMQQSIASHVAELETARSETERKNKELTVAKTLAEESDRKKTAFVQDMFHQIRTPLNIISGFAQVLRDGHSLMSEKDLDDVTREIKLNGQTISNIIDNWKKVLELEQDEEISQADLVDCGALCQEVVRDVVMRNPDTVTLKVELPADNLTITTNKDYLTKILSELLHNANKYTLQGHITIGCERVGDDCICFYVADSGPGIPKEDQERVFTQFTKLNNFNEGLGMGLFLCRQLAQRLGATLMLDTQYVDGTRMVLSFCKQK
jgi:signal transduction histidine kinase